MLGPMRRRFDVSAMAWRGSAVVLAVACYGLAGAANAWAVTGAPASGGEAPVAERTTEPSPPAKATDDGRGPKAARREITSKQRVDPRGLKKRAEIESAPEPDPAPAGAGPKWACDAKTITMKPQWLGTPLKATWVVRNKGTVDLAIKLRGG